MASLALLSYHTSPLAQPGTGDGGGMNVYVRELATALARAGHEVDVFTRREDTISPETVVVEPGFRVRVVTAGPVRELERDELPVHVDAFADGVAAVWRHEGPPTAIHANYWLSGVAGHRLKHEWSLPMLVTFHTLERVKAETFAAESLARAEAEQAIFNCADAVLASCDVEAAQCRALYGADEHRLHIVPLGVEHALFSPGFRPQARRALGLDPSRSLLLFAGRLQQLKGVDLALETLVALRARGRDAQLAIVGGPSGPEGRATVARLHARVDECGLIDRVLFVAPQSHTLLSTWFRAADVTLVPSFAESFGLVALESSACGTPVVASDVGGLTTLIEDGVTGFLVASREPEKWADATERALDPDRSTSLSNEAVLKARGYTWRAAARTVADLVERLDVTGLVHC